MITIQGYLESLYKMNLMQALCLSMIDQNAWDLFAFGHKEANKRKG